MSKVLVKWSGNWADEMNVEGFVIMEDSEWKEYQETAKKVNSPFSISVGTNEDIEYPNGTALLENIKAKKLTTDEAKTIIKFFGEYGGQDYFRYCLDDALEDEYEVEDEESYYEDEEDEEENF
jgi:hypothetical protein